jgi:protein-disulfide isomerase
MEQEDKNAKSSNFLAVSILVAALIIGGSLVYSSSLKSDGASGDATAKVEDIVDRKTPSNTNVTADDDVILGNPDAGVAIIEFGDYQCPFCKKLFEQIEQQIIKEYVKTGKAYLVYRDFPLDAIHPYARPAAEAAECARDQGKYWEYHDELFGRQSELASLDFVALAAELGFDKAEFKQCVDSGKYKKEVQSDYEDGVAAGVRGTPATFIVANGNAELISGAQPYEAFKAAIERALQSLEQ